MRAPSSTLDAQQQDSIRVLVGRLELERYKATIKSLTTFGDRRQGTDRNRAAVDWIEAQLKSYGCTNTERIGYEYLGRQLRSGGAGNRGGGGRGGADSASAVAAAAAAITAARTAADSTAAARGGRAGGAAATGAAGVADAGAARRGGGGGGGGGAAGRGGGRGGNPPKGFTAPTGVNTNPEAQPDTALRRINMQPDEPGGREQVFCTKIGTKFPNEMYIIGAHMDGHGFGAAANDDGSGTALVMELARIFHSPDVQTERSIRFILFNNEETGGGAAAYVLQRLPMQGVEDPPGSGKYPEPKWLGMVQHDMMLWDHGMPGPDGKVSAEQRREADVNVEFAGTATMADSAQKLAWYFRQMNDRYATDYPVAVGDRMSNTDSRSFQNYTAAISLRENERLAHTGTGWNPTWHQPIDVYETFSDKDFRLGLNAAQTTLAAIASLVGVSLRR
jgi:hypothetical protein